MFNIGDMVVINYYNNNSIVHVVGNPDEESVTVALIFDLDAGIPISGTFYNYKIDEIQNPVVIANHLTPQQYLEANHPEYLL